MRAARGVARRLLWRLGLGLWCLAAATFAWPLEAAAQPAPALTITPERGRCGQAVTLRGEQFPPGNRVTLRGPRFAATGDRLTTYRELATVVAADGSWAITTTLFCPSGDSTWALVDNEDPACYVPSPPCIELLFTVASLPPPSSVPQPGADYGKGLRVRITSARLPGVPNTGDGGAVAPAPSPSPTTRRCAADGDPGKHSPLAHSSPAASA